MLPLSLFVSGFALAVFGSMKIDLIDDASGRRPGGYGSNKSYHPIYTTCCQVGFAMALLSPFAALL